MIRSFLPGSSRDDGDSDSCRARKTHEAPAALPLVQERQKDPWAKCRPWSRYIIFRVRNHYTSDTVHGTTHTGLVHTALRQSFHDRNHLTTDSTPRAVWTPTAVVHTASIGLGYSEMHAILLHYRDLPSPLPPDDHQVNRNS